MSAWSERQKQLMNYQQSYSYENLPLEKAFALLDEMREMAFRMGYQLDPDWFLEHQAIHHRIREALAAIHPSNKGA